MTKLKRIGILLLALLVLIVVLQNTEPVETRILFFAPVLPRALLLGVTLLVGIALGIAISGKLTRTKDKTKP